MDENQQGGEPIETFPPNGTIIRSVCKIGAQLWHHIADGMGGFREEYKGISTNCANSITRNNLVDHLAWYRKLTANTNMLKKVEAAEISKQLNAFEHLAYAATYVLETSEGNYVVLVGGPRKMTFWENVKWKLFGAVPYAKSQNALIAEAYEKAGVVIVQETDE
jgi:elongation factor P hydroxylase